MMSAHNPLQPYRFFNQGALIGVSVATLYIVLGLLFFPALLAFSMGLGWLGIIGLSGVATPIIINYLRPAREATPAEFMSTPVVFIVLGALAAVASAFTLPLLPSLISSILCLSTTGLIGGVVGSGIFECIRIGWRNFFTSEYEPIPSTYPEATGQAHSTELMLTSLTRTPAAGRAYEAYQNVLHSVDSDNDSEPSDPLTLTRTQPHSGVRLLRSSSTEAIEVKGHEDLESGSDDDTTTLTVDSNSRYQSGRG
jgi:hypothetical protein